MTVRRAREARRTSLRASLPYLEKLQRVTRTPQNNEWWS